MEAPSTGASNSDEEEEEEEEEEEKQGDIGAGVMNTQASKSLQQQKQLSKTLGKEISVRGAPWFEDLIENSKLGTLRRRKGGHTSKDGSVSVEWEVAEWESSGAGGIGSGNAPADVQAIGKRKLGDVVADTDVSMRNI